jgi:hypothetical protein
MVRNRYSPAFLLIASCLIGVLIFAPREQASGQSPLWTGIVSTSRAVNWSNVGATISTTRTQCGSTVAAGTSAATINSDLAACSGSYLLLGPGTFNLTTGLFIPSNVTLRGSGSNSTFLVFSGGYSCRGGTVHICAASSDTNYWGGPSNSASWTAGYAQGATSITLNSKSGNTPVVGQPIILDQIDNQSDNGALYVGCEIGSGTSGGDGSAQCYSGAGPNGFERGEGALSTIRGQQQIVTVTSITGSGSGPYTVGISPGLYAPNWASGNSPGAWWASSPEYNVGVESLSIDNTADGNSGILFFNCQGCWVKGVRSIITSGSTPTGWYHVALQMCNHCTVRDSYFYGYMGDTYPITAEIASDALFENNIIQFPSMYQFYNSDCEGCVSGYNFSASQLFGSPGSSNWLQQSTQFHGIDLYVLSEGNIGPGFYGDSFHGTHDLDTFFRNRLDGNEQNGGAAITSNTVAFRMNPGTRFMNVVANILGTVGFHTVYKGNTNGSNEYSSVIGCGAYAETGMSGDSLSCATSLWWGNWDNVTNAARWCATSSDTGWSSTCASTSEIPTGAAAYPNSSPTVGDTGAGQGALPASFYYSAQPSWWPSGKAWPVIGPDVTGGNVGQCVGGTNSYDEVTSSQSSQCTSTAGKFTALPTVISNPAMDCYFNSMGGLANGTGGALAFDSNACYAASTTAAPAPPTNLQGSPSVISN